MGYIFRPHRFELTNAMKEVKEFETKQEMFEYIRDEWSKDWHKPMFDVSDIVMNEDYKINDDRIGWKDTMYVCIKRCGDQEYEHPACIGMCATDYAGWQEIYHEFLRHWL